MTACHLSVGGRNLCVRKLYPIRGRKKVQMMRCVIVVDTFVHQAYLKFILAELLRYLQDHCRGADA